MESMWLEVLRAVLYGLVVIVLAGTAFVGGAFTAKKTDKTQSRFTLEVPPAEREEGRRSLEEALAARFDGRHAEALRLLEEVRRSDPSLKGLDYQFALTYLDLGEYALADERARRSVEHGEEKSNAQALRGLILLEKSRRDGSLAAQGPEILSVLRASRDADPLNPMPLYVMGEYYRADGKPGLAVDAYRRALERVSKTDSYLVTSVKAGLADLRLNYRPGDPPLKLQKINGVLPPEQLFFGAADALLRDDKVAAAGFLTEAKTRIPENVFLALLQDSFFQDYLGADIPYDPQVSDPQP